MTRQYIEAIRARCERAKRNPVGNAYATHDEYEREITELLDILDDETKRAQIAEKAVVKTLERFREKCGWCRDYKQCRYDHNWDACNKLQFDYTVEQMEADEKLLDDTIRENGRYKARCEALERAIKYNSPCETCICQDDCDTYGRSIRCTLAGFKPDGWVFDEDRFAKEEVE